uniref:BUD13 homolog n=1 Tax=Aplanochytrium stocchinoi TaxID=215587 RepID=A0A7S3PN01_9STRA
MSGGSGSGSSKSKYLQRYLYKNDNDDDSDSDSDSRRKPDFGLKSDYKESSKKRKHHKKQKKKEKKKHKDRKNKGKDKGNDSDTGRAIKEGNVIIQDEDSTNWKKKPGTLGPLGVDPFDEDAPVIVDTDQSHSHKRVRHDSTSESDNGHHSGSDSDSDVSVPRKNQTTATRLRHDSSDENESDLSDNDNDSDSDSDMAVPRRPKRLKRAQENAVKDEKVFDVGGIKDKETFRREAEQRRKQRGIEDTEENAAAMGKNATTVYRDRRGRKLDMLNEFMRSRDMTEGKKVLEKKLEYEWGVGKIDKEKAEENRRELEDAKNSSFSRYADDEVINDRLKSRIRSGDPMAALLSSNSSRRNNNPNSFNAGQQAQQNNSKPVYKGPPPAPNRFGIQPGYRWDGIDRGSGFEKKYLEAQNTKKADSEERYKWSVSDM